jgi:hypothetical protein
MWEMVPSLAAVVQGCAIAFTEPSAVTFRQVLLGWIMCLCQIDALRGTLGEAMTG